MINHKIHKLKIDIGTHPFAHHSGPTDISQYGAILDVSDYPTYNIDGTMPHAHHCPIIEWDGWGYAPLYWAVKLLDHYIAKGVPIYLHCYAGKHRSTMIGFLYLMSLGHSMEEAAAMFDTQWDIELDNDIANSRIWLQRFYEKDILRKRIPADAVEFMKNVRSNPSKSALQILSIMRGQHEDDPIDTAMYITFSEKKQ